MTQDQQTNGTRTFEVKGRYNVGLRERKAIFTMDIDPLMGLAEKPPTVLYL